MAALVHDLTPLCEPPTPFFALFDLNCQLLLVTGRVIIIFITPGHPGFIACFRERFQPH